MGSHPKVLILGGTEDARLQASKLAECGFSVVYSLAGVTAKPSLPEHANIQIHSGGFSGGFSSLHGLQDFIQTNAITCVVDATHPFATQISDTCARLKSVPVVRLNRPVWQQQPNDKWHHVSDLNAAIELVGQATDKTVFLSLGVKHLKAFYALKHARLIARMIELPTDAPDHIQLIQQRGPFEVKNEMDLFQRLGVNLLVTRNSGAAASYPKIEAARQLGIPVVMIQPPPYAASPHVEVIQASQLVAHLSQI